MLKSALFGSLLSVLLSLPSTAVSAPKNGPLVNGCANKPGQSACCRKETWYDELGFPYEVVVCGNP